jgi:RimJ/RimL family protein N-acetyltransferase
MFIRSERLFLRPAWPEDWQELFARVADEAVVRNLARAPWPYTSEHARNFAEQPQDPRCPHFFITLPTASGPAAMVGCVGLVREQGEVALGYWIGKDFWGRGYATEAVRAVLNLARTLGHVRITASNFADNPASGRVLRKAGFQPTGKIEQRFCLARGAEVPAVLHVAELATSGDCNDDDPRMSEHRAA